MDLTIRIGGEAGQGLQLIGGVLSKMFSRYGLHVFTHQDYMSRIRGGHNYYQIRISQNRITASRNVIDILMALDADTVSFHRKDLAENGIILYDAETVKKEFTGKEFVNVPFFGITETKGISSIMSNSVAVGAMLGILGFELDLFEKTIAGFLGNKGKEVIATNKDAAQAEQTLVLARHGHRGLVAFA